MLLYGTLEIQILDSFTGLSTQHHRPLRSLIMTRKINNKYYMTVKNSMSHKPVDYDLTNIEMIHSRFIDDGKLTIRFKLPKHNLLLKGDDVSVVKLFLKQILKMIKGENLQMFERQLPKVVPAKKKLNPFDPMSLEHVAIAHFDSRVLNMRHLNKLVLENCKLPSLPVEIGSLPIVHLSLSGSDITSPQCKFDLFWKWMSGETICNSLSVLKMDSISLTSLPFEIFFLKNLNTLSLTNNKLHYLPHFIGELGKLRKLYVSNNLLKYFPSSILGIKFDVLDISDNNLSLTEFGNYPPLLNGTDSSDHIHKYKVINKLTSLSTLKNANELTLLSFCTLVNHHIKIKREDIPFTLWHLYDLVARCSNCNKIIAPHYAFISHDINYPNAITLIQNRAMIYFTWQSVKCESGCRKMVVK